MKIYNIVSYILKHAFKHYPSSKAAEGKIINNSSALMISLIFINLLNICPCLTYARSTQEKIEKINQSIKKLFIKIDNNRLKKSTEENSYKCATPIILYALNHKEFLWPENSFILNRPLEDTDKNYYGDVDVWWYDSSEIMNPKKHNFRIHYTEDNTYGDAVAKSDGNQATIPEYIKRLSASLEYAWHEIINIMGYIPPRLDGEKGGGYNQIDVYVLNINNAYGFTSLDEDKCAYMFIKNNLDAFGDERAEIASVHEFFHIIQYEYEDWYDINRDTYKSNLWWEESTAVWIEDELYDETDAYLVYLKHRFKHFDIPLDYNGDDPSYFEYGGVIFVKFLSETHGRDIVRKIFERCRHIEPPLAKQAIGDVLIKNYNSNWGKTMREFFIKNLKRDYEEGRNYPFVSMTRILTDTEIINCDSPIQRLDHLAGHYLMIQSYERAKYLYLELNKTASSISPIAAVMAAPERIYRSDLSLIEPYEETNFLLENFGLRGNYNKAYLIVINPDPVNDNSYYSLNTCIEAPETLYPENGEIIVIDQESLPYTLTFLTENLPLYPFPIIEPLFYTFDLYISDTTHPLNSKIIQQNPKGITACEIEIHQKDWYSWRCQVNTMNKTLLTKNLPLKNFYLLTKKQEIRGLLSPHKFFEIEVKNPNSPVRQASIEGTWEKDTNQWITISYATDPDIPTRGIIPFGNLYFFEPEGLEFSREVKITLPYNQDEFEKVNIEDSEKLRIYNYQIKDSKVHPVSDFSHDIETKAFIGHINRLSAFFLGYEGPLLKGKTLFKSTDEGCFICVLSQI